jgi:uncharacterized membrane protein
LVCAVNGGCVGLNGSYVAFCLVRGLVRGDRRRRRGDSEVDLHRGSSRLRRRGQVELLVMVIVVVVLVVVIVVLVMMVIMVMVIVVFVVFVVVMVLMLVVLVVLVLVVGRGRRGGAVSFVGAFGLDSIQGLEQVIKANTS